jgi:hypothetical protein
LDLTKQEKQQHNIVLFSLPHGDAMVPRQTAAMAPGEVASAPPTLWLPSPRSYMTDGGETSSGSGVSLPRRVGACLSPRDGGGTRLRASWPHPPSLPVVMTVVQTMESIVVPPGRIPRATAAGLAGGDNYVMQAMGIVVVFPPGPICGSGGRN